MRRTSIDETWLMVAIALAHRGTCMKFKVGCVLTDSAGHLLAANYNGVAAGEPHCNEVSTFSQITGKRPLEYLHKCAGASAPAGSDLCEAIHAEQNALTRCLLPDQVFTCYLTTSPCMRCTKQLLNTNCKRILFLDEYTREPQAKELWTRRGRDWVLHVSKPGDPLFAAETQAARQGILLQRSK